METIKNIVSDVIGRMSGETKTSDLQAAWTKISKSKESRVIDFKNGCVVISADTSMRLVRFNLNREALLKELQKEIPAVKKLSFKVTST